MLINWLEFYKIVRSNENLLMRSLKKPKKGKFLCCFEFKSMAELAPILPIKKSMGWEGGQGRALLNVLNIPCLDIF